MKSFLACILSTGCLLSLSALADENKTSELDEKPLNVGTLDWLKEQGAELPDGSGTYPESAYTLSSASETGENTLTLYEYDSKTGTVSAKTYKLELKETEFGSGDSSVNLKWEKTEDGFLLTNVEKGETPDITFKYNEKETSPRIEADASNADGISGVFIGNDSSASIDGGAIYNEGAKIATIKGSFIDNNARQGGAIYNNGTIGSIEGVFINNRAPSTTMGLAGAIYNLGTINSIKADFIGNIARGRGSDDNNYGGGAINNAFGAEIGNLIGNFIGNSAVSERWYGGGAINNQGSVIGNIIGDFIGNNAKGTGVTVGGALRSFYNPEHAAHNKAEIKNIVGDFIGNNAISTGHEAWGGAIVNENASIGSITGNFIGNYTQSGGDKKSVGGAIFNEKYADITKITGNFYGNSAGTTGSTGMVAGGAINNNNNSVIGSITGDFIGNYVSATNGTAQGGAIWNNAIIGTKEGNTLTGGIVNSSFLKNHATTQGGAIYTSTDLNIIADGSIKEGHKDIEFTGNYIGDENTPDYQAVYVGNNSATLTLDAKNTGSITFNDKIEGVSGYKINLTGDNLSSTVALNNEVNNASVTLENVTLKIGLTDGLTSNVFANSALTVNSGLVNMADKKFGTYNFKELISDAKAQYSLDVAIVDGLAKNDVFNVANSASSGTITLSNLVFQEFSSIDAQNEEEYIFQIIKGSDGSLQLQFADELKTIENATADMNSGQILAKAFELYETDSENDSVRVVGWRDNLAAWAELEDADNKTFTINKGDTQTLTRDIEVLEGTNLSISGTSNNVLDLQGFNLLKEIGENQVFSLSNLKLFNASEIMNDGELNLSDVTLEDSLKITNTNELNIMGKTNLNNTVDNTGHMTLSAAETIISGTVTGDGSIRLEKESLVDIIGKVNGQSIVNGNAVTNLYNITEFKNNSLTMTGGEFNVFNLGEDKLIFNKLNLNNGTFNVKSVDADLQNKNMGGIYQTIDNLAKDNATGVINLENINIRSDGKELLTSVLFTNTKADVSLGSNHLRGPIYEYNVSFDNTGNYGDGGYVLFERDGFNPEIEAEPVAEMAGGYAAMLQTYEYAFEHADRFSALPKNAKLTGLCESVVCAASSGVLPPEYGMMGSRAGWIKPYGTFENMPLKNGPRVDTKLYGTMIGADSNLVGLGNGWYSALTGYLGSNHATQSYDMVRAKQDSVIVGDTQSFYKDNFYTAVTVSGGYASGDITTSFGKDHFRMKMGGAAVKSGYNFTFEDGKYIIQPNMLMSYTMLNADDYTAASTARINSKTTGVFQLHPHVKFIANTESGYQPYAVAGVVYNNGKTDVTANGVDLPGLSIKPYAEYGAGVQKNWGDDVTGYAQTIFRSGGRSGASITAGMRWNF